MKTAQKTFEICDEIFSETEIFSRRNENLD
jgi:hypothetical protein